MNPKAQKVFVAGLLLIISQSTHALQYCSAVCHCIQRAIFCLHNPANPLCKNELSGVIERCRRYCCEHRDCE